MILPDIERKPRHGIQAWAIGESRVFVLTNPSGANARGPWDGRLHKIEWWQELSHSGERRLTWRT